MGNHKDLFSTEAVAKIKEMAEDIKTCMFCTDLSSRPVPVRPMSVLEVDDHGNLWFLSSRNSNKNLEIKQDEDVQLIFADNADFEYLSVYGKAVIYTDRNHIDEVWTSIAKTWFEEGKDDPNATVIKVATTDAYYWDTKSGKMITMLKYALGALVGSSVDDNSLEGRLKV
nr:pyridoxamine 5'-phosphate oxidase family protein [uncultured Flavobacterium sp.]